MRIRRALERRVAGRHHALRDDRRRGDGSRTGRLELASGEDITARLVVAADGRRSTVREAVGIEVTEWRYDQSALVVNLGHALPHQDTSTEFHTEAGPLTRVPIAGRRSSLVWVDRPGEVARGLTMDETELAAEIEERSSSLLGAIRIDGPRQAFPLAGMTALGFARSRAVLVGEAAHLFPPIGAQGLNLGYRDVRALGEILSGRGCDPGAASRLAAYERPPADVVARTTAVDAEPHAAHRLPARPGAPRPRRFRPRPSASLRRAVMRRALPRRQVRNRVGGSVVGLPAGRPRPSRGPASASLPHRHPDHDHRHRLFL
jgi:ubiquinone biosynthesis UbiH/UbiF/VisC/COQ6 family hydroxylase